MPDDVDAIVAEIAQAFPRLDAEPLSVTARVTRLARHVEFARRQALAPRELEPWEFDVLLALRAQPKPHQLTPTQLITATQVASGTMTNRVDKLVRRSFVSREPDPSDRRGILVRLTATGRRRVDAALPAVLKADESVLEGLSARRREQLPATLAAALAPLDA